MLRFREVKETEEVREEKEKRVIAESKLSKLVKERKGELEMRTNVLDQPIVKEINNNKEGEAKMDVKDYVGYILGNDTEELTEIEKHFMDLEQKRLDEQINIDDLRLFKENGVEEIKVLEYCGLAEEMIFEGLKGLHIMFNIIEEGDTYRSFFEKLSDNKFLKREYNIIAKNVFNIYYKSMEEMSLTYA